jgi:hypothetical protein
VANPDNNVTEEADLAQRISASEDSDDVVSTTLKTDDRVIARVTDGIYRQPASAFRELISNAYDADASRVVIKTDAPRFERIVVEDNGQGMTPAVLAHLLLHIGGSAKRSDEGQELGITSSDNSAFSPKGRRLIGKIGIGIFSVSQLTHTFQIITKVKGDSFRTIATIALKQYSDDETYSDKDTKKFESGKVNIWREKASDTKSHGTTIVLTSIRPQARNTLQSNEVWAAIEQESASAKSEDDLSLEPPKFHIGRVDESGEILRKTATARAAVPWDATDSPDEAFRKLVNSIWDELEQANPNPKLERVFDYYLRMVWQLGLAVPLPYVDGHPFDMVLEGWAKGFQLSNEPKGAAIELESMEKTPLRRQLSLKDPPGTVGTFDVFVDNLKLSRPIRFKNLPTTGHALKQPLVFLGKCRQTFEGLARELSGGPLAFEAYLFWSPKIAPTEHQGSLIRIHGSSGTLFDPTFMRYQVSEQTRLRQITCEVFVTEGLESALNIDRESFNSAHPHAVYITKWIHSSLRQLATAQKRLAGGVREQVRDEQKDEVVSGIRAVARDTWAAEADDPASQPPSVELVDAGAKTKLDSNSYAFDRSVVAPQRGQKQTPKSKIRRAVLDEKLKAITQVLASFGVLDTLSKPRQQKLLKAIYKILSTPES